MLLQRNQLSQLFHLEQLALDHLLCQFDERIQNAKVALLYRYLERLHVKPVARQHALRIPPLRIRCRASASRFGLINNVVVNERRRVNNLDDRPQANRAAPLIVEKLRSQKKQNRTDALATAVSQIFANFGDGLDARDRIAAKLPLNRREVLPQHFEYFFAVNNSRCAQKILWVPTLSRGCPAPSRSLRRGGKPNPLIRSVIRKLQI